MIRLFLADDHPTMVSGLERLLHGTEGFSVVGTRHDLRGLDLRELPEVDVFVLDVSMPGMHGAETIGPLVASGAKVLLFTLEPESVQVVALLRAGATGVVSKSASVSELLDAIRRVAGGRTVIPIDLLERSASSGTGLPHESLSERESEIFLRLIRGVSPKAIAYELSLSPSTVYTYAERIRQKLGVQSPVELVDYAHRAGLLGRGSLER